MDFGITVATAADSWKVVKRAEELGFTYAWFYDTQMLNADPFVAMAAAAVHTRTIHRGPGVLVPSNRLAPVTAKLSRLPEQVSPRADSLWHRDGFYRPTCHGAWRRQTG